MGLPCQNSTSQGTTKYPPQKSGLEISFPSNFRSNSIDINLGVPILNINFITAYHVIQQYNCNIFLNSNNNIKLSYYNGFNQLVIDDIDD